MARQSAQLPRGRDSSSSRLRSLARQLALALSTGDDEGAAEALAHGADPDFRARPEDASPLEMAARFGQSEALALMLPLAAPGEADARGWSLCMHAAACGQPEALRLILAFGRDPRHASLDGSTALHCAARYGESHQEQAAECVRILLPLCGGSAVDARGRDALMVAIAHEMPLSAELLAPACGVQRRDREGMGARGLLAQSFGGVGGMGREQRERLSALLEALEIAGEAQAGSGSGEARRL